MYSKLGTLHCADAEISEGSSYLMVTYLHRLSATCSHPYQDMNNVGLLMSLHGDYLGATDLNYITLLSMFLYESLGPLSYCCIWFPLSKSS